MLALARFALKGPYQAASVVGLLAVVAVFLPPVIGVNFPSVALAVISLILATILVGLIILTQGSASGLKAIGVSVLGVTAVAWVVLNSPEQGVLIALVYWLPVVILAQTLRSSGSLGLTLVSGVAMGIVGIVLQYLVWSDLQADLQSQMLASAGGQEQLTEDEIRQIRLSVQVLGLMLIASLYLLYVLVIFAARWLQARLLGSDGFGREFRALALGKPAALAGIVLVPTGFVVGQPWLASLAFLIVFAFMFQGIAVVHALLAKRRQATLLFALFYFLLFFAAQITAALTSITGMIDNWLDFRKLKAEIRKDDDES